MLKERMQAIILAAGRSTRLKTGHNKLLENICGQPMIIFSTKLFESLEVPTTVVIGYQKDLISACIAKYHQGGNISFAIQENPQGTGHALECTREHWKKDHILIMNGDMPLVTADIIEALYAKHIESGATLSFAMAHYTDPNTSYGRVVKNENRIKIVEAKEFKDSSADDHCCINAGIYIVKRSFLEDHIQDLEPNAISKEFHITDLIEKASTAGEPIATISAPFDYIRGINNQHELWAAEQIQRSNIIKYWMENGVRFSVAHNVHIDLDVTIGAGSYIGCGAHLLYGTKVGANCKINEYAALENAVVGDNVIIYPFTIIKDSTIGNNAQVGPFAHVRTNTVIADQAVIGNFIEIKNSTIGTASKAKHLAYIGDTTMGAEVNVGAGTITCNYDGKNKYKTVIEDNAFIGSNNTIIAPVTIGAGAFTAGGSTITKDVPPQALAIGRSEQINKLEYLNKNKIDDILEDDDEQIIEREFIGATLTTHDMMENDA